MNGKSTARFWIRNSKFIECRHVELDAKILVMNLGWV